MNTKPGIIGTKLGMTHLYKEDGTVQRVTVRRYRVTMVLRCSYTSSRSVS